MKLQKTKREQYSITLPKQIVIALGWSKGNKIDYKLDNKKLILTNKE